MSPNLRRAVLALAVAGLAGSVVPALAQSRNTGTPPAKTIYCWEDRNGARTCGDALPAEAVDNARSEFSATGMLTRRLGRALTEEERAAAEALAEQERQAAAERAARNREELAMVQSYDSEAALRKAFGARLELVEASARSSELGIESVRSSLMNLLRRAAEAELAGDPVPEPIAAGIIEQHDGLRRQQALLRQQEVQRRLLAEELEQALARYRELKEGSGGR